MKKFNLTVVLLLFLSSVLFAQKGIIRGKITDAETGEEIIGATISIPGTEPLVGTVSDFEGNFSLENVTGTNVNLQCSFISYQTQIVENVEIKNGNVQILNIQLGKAVQEIKEVVISSNAVRNTANAMQTLQKKSGSLINGLSSQEISRQGDSDAASAVKRVSGVSVTGGKYIFVRGLSDRYSKITLNSAEIPGLDPNKNTVQMDIFPSNVIDNIIIHKTFSPDLPASFTGGYVNIETKNFPNKFTLHFSTSFGYNANSSLQGFLSHKGGKTDILGIDDGTRSVPTAAQGSVPFLYENNDLLDEVTASFNKTMEAEEKQSFLNHSHSFSIGNQTKLFGKPLGFILATSYSHDYKQYKDGEYNKYQYVDGTMTPLLIETERAGNEEILMSALLGLSYKLNRNNKIGINFLRNSSGLISTRYREGNKIEDNLYMYENTLGFQERSLNSVQLTGNHVLAGMKKFQIDWISSYTLSGQAEPDLRFFNYDSPNGGETYQISPNAYPSPARFYREMSETNIDNKIDFTQPVKMFGGETKIKFGGAFTYKKRNSDSRKFDLLSQQLDFNGSIADYLADENMGQNSDATYGYYYQNDEITDSYNSYFAQEMIGAGYAMVDVPINWVRVVAGARYEYDYTFIENNVRSSHHKYVRAEHIYPTDILPGANVNFSLSQNMNIRTAYSRTVARPSFREIAPYAYYDFKEGWRVVGNPDLQRTMIDNADIRWEYFMPMGQIISVSGFYKYFTNPIELVDDPRANNPEFHYVNIENSSMYGFEIEMRKNLGFIGVRDLMVGGNFTLLKSEVEVVDDYGAAGATISKRPMYGQAPWVVNSFIGYNNNKIKLSTNVGFNLTGEKLAVVTKGETPNIYQQPVPSLNFNIAKGFGDRLKFKFAVNNILDSENKKTYTFEGKEYIFQSYKYGRTFSLGFSYNIN